MKQNTLIIEKNEGIQFLLNTVLQKSFRIFRHNNCLSGIDAVRNYNISAVIISLDTIEELNYDFIVHIKTSYLFSSIPVFVITNNNSKAFAEHLKGIGVSEIVPKPFDPLSLLRMLEESMSSQEYVYDNTAFAYNMNNTRKLKVGFLG